jgi:hypothetical protein
MIFFSTTPEPQSAPASTTLTLEKALTDAFIRALQVEFSTTLTVTAAENFAAMTLPACFVKATRQSESIIGSAIFQFTVDVVLAVQADDADAQILENRWADILDITHDVFGLVAKLNALNPRFCYVYGILRDGPVAASTTERHFLRSVSVTVHTALLG